MDFLFRFTYKITLEIETATFFCKNLLSFLPLIFNTNFSFRLAYQTKANAEVEFSHFWVPQTHIRPIKQINKLITATQSSFMHLSLAQNSNVTDEYGSLRTSKKTLISFYTRHIWHYHFKLHLVSLLTWYSKHLTFLTNAGSATDSVTFEVGIFSLYTLVTYL